MAKAVSSLTSHEASCRCVPTRNRKRSTSTVQQQRRRREVARLDGALVRSPVVLALRALDYTTKLSTNSAELRAVAALRATVFREEYDKLITVAECMQEAQKTRAISTVEWDRLEKSIKAGETFCVSAWLGKCEEQTRKAILEETDRSTMQIKDDSEPSPVIGSLDVSWKLPKDVERFYKEEVLVGEMKTIRAAYLCNVGVLSSARGCGVASSLLDFALSEARSKGNIDYLFTHQHREEMLQGNHLYLKHGYTECNPASAPKAAVAAGSTKDQILLGRKIG